MEKTATEALDKVEFLLAKYSFECRATTQPYVLRRIQAAFPNYQYNPDAPLVRETLLEHVGSLPIITTALFPYINDPEVNLGAALSMLAVHDIGELETGDEITFTKEKSSKEAEHEVAQRLLDPLYHDLYRDIESQGSQTAKFAKAMDKIAPDILDYLTPADITVVRYQHFLGIGPEEIVPLILTHKRPYMLWNPFLVEFHAVLLKGLEDKINKLL